jgi:hypothetical protein
MMISKDSWLGDEDWISFEVVVASMLEGDTAYTMVGL